MIKKGSNCSRSGNAYELCIYNILKHVTVNGKTFNNQSVSELGGSNSRNDIVCIYNDKPVGIEIKKYNTPDWMQCSLRKDIIKDSWVGSDKCKIPSQCRNIFNDLLNNVKLFDGCIPPFVDKKMTYEEWTKIKSETNQWNDQYFDIPNNTISKMYNIKGCDYIQISEYGLYHLGNDICSFHVPEFIIDQQIRIRTKVHKCTNKTNDLCRLSITASCKPRNIKQLPKSQYSLDDIKKLPVLCIYNDNL